MLNNEKIQISVNVAFFFPSVTHLLKQACIAEFAVCVSAASHRSLNTLPSRKRDLFLSWHEGVVRGIHHAAKRRKIVSSQLNKIDHNLCTEKSNSRCQRAKYLYIYVSGLSPA